MAAVVQTNFMCDRCKDQVTCPTGHTRPSLWLTLKEQRSDRPIQTLPNGEVDLCVPCASAFKVWLTAFRKDDPS